MSKARKRASSKRRHYFSRLAKDDPEQFRIEWNKRLKSWKRWVETNADTKDSSTSVSKVVGEALGILETCGHHVSEQWASKTFLGLISAYFRGLAKRREKELSSQKGNPFETAWDSCVTTLMVWINENAGKISNDVPAVFSVVDDAKKVLLECYKCTDNKNIKAFIKKLERETDDLLTTQCCIAFSINALPQFYRVSGGKMLIERP